MLGRKPSVPTVIFQAYSAAYRDRCLAIFAANCPGYFAPNERSDYISFLDAPTPGYELCLIDGIVVGAFGLTGDAAVRNLNWVMLAPQSRGRGLGAALMARVVSQAQDAAVT
ncbi:MAG: GNAT family N-acetyltransferase, partial [SAR86 cluster bacterium]|nr:GNAT family N-acetyltransferase [SAR86 cluster bacterium]